MLQAKVVICCGRSDITTDNVKAAAIVLLVVVDAVYELLLSYG